MATSTLDLLNSLSGTVLSDALNNVSPVRNAFSNFIEAETAFSAGQVVSRHLDQFRFAQKIKTIAVL